VYITSEYIFVHAQKMAGVTVKDFMLSKFPDCHIEVYKHAPLRCLPKKHAEKIRIGVIRNPFDWYVSFYAYRKQNGEFKNMSFTKFIKTYTKHPRALLTGIEKKIVKSDYDKLLPPRTNLNIGSYTYFFINYFSMIAVDVLSLYNDRIFKEQFSRLSDMDILMRTENLADDMFKLWKDDRVFKLKPKNTSKHKPYQDYYTDETRKIVEEKDGIFMKEFGYSYG